MMTNITNKINLKRPDLVEPELSYRVVDTLFMVFNELGPDLREKYYQNAVAIGLREQGIKFKKQQALTLDFLKEKVGKCFVDFIIDDKIILELKTGSQINRRHAK